MNLRRLAAFVAFASLFATPVHAQDPQKPEAKPEAGAKQDPAKPEGDAKQEPARPEAGPGKEPDPKIIEGIVGCLADGLPEGWVKAWFVIKEIGQDATGKTRKYEARFRYATSAADKKGKVLVPCGANKILEGVGALNEYLPGDQQRWTGATFSFHSDGKYEAQYDFTPPKPAAKPAAKKKADAKK
jgi:hypothetical protein